MNVARRLIPAVVVVIAASVFAIADENVDRAAVNKAALENLQGRWKVVSIVKQGQDVGDIAKLELLFTFKDDSLTVTTDRQGSTPRQGLIRLEANDTPMLLDWAESAKAFDERKDVVEGVYSLAGDTLEWCYNFDGDQPTKASRPAAVESKADSRTWLMKLERVKE